MLPSIGMMNGTKTRPGKMKAGGLTMKTKLSLILYLCPVIRFPELNRYEKDAKHGQHIWVRLTLQP